MVGPPATVTHTAGRGGAKSIHRYGAIGAIVGTRIIARSADKAAAARRLTLWQMMWREYCLASGSHGDNLADDVA